MDKITRQIRIEHWTQIMNECLNSGMNKTEWCRANGISDKQFFYWQRILRKEAFAAGPLFRNLIAQFYDTPLAENCEISLVQSDAAEHAQLSADRALLSRLLENLLNNSIRHNTDLIEISGLVEISVHTEIEIAENLFRLTVTDNGKGYPPEVLATLHSDETPDNTPHILGLHVVEQIATAHGGKTLFCQNVPAGAKAVVWLPVE